MGKDVAAVTNGGAVRAVDDLRDAMVLPNSVWELHDFAWVVAARVMPDEKEELLKLQRLITGGSARAAPRGPGAGETAAVGILGAAFARVAEELALVSFFWDGMGWLSFPLTPWARWESVLASRFWCRLYSFFSDEKAFERASRGIFFTLAGIGVAVALSSVVLVNPAEEPKFVR